jgi:hypothetical protein
MKAIPSACRWVKGLANSFAEVSASATIRQLTIPCEEFEGGVARLAAKRSATAVLLVSSATVTPSKFTSFFMVVGVNRLSKSSTNPLSFREFSR